MGTQTHQLVAGAEQLRNAGDYAFMVRGCEPVGLRLLCPGCGAPMTLFFGDDPASCRHWRFDGDRNEPTLDGEIVALCCGWRGYLRSGEWMKPWEVEE